MTFDRKAYMKQYHKDHKEEKKVHDKKYHDTHKVEDKLAREKWKEEHPNYDKEYHKTHITQDKERRKTYHDENRERENELCKIWSQEHPEERKAYGKKYHLETYKGDKKEEVQRKAKDRARALRNSFIEMYGGICNLCGEDEKSCLTMDHVNDDGSENKKRKAWKTEYKKAIKIFDPKTYQILCYNCNCGRKKFWVSNSTEKLS